MKKKLISVFVFSSFASALCFGGLKSKKEDIPPVLGGVVRSDKWIMKRNPPREEFIGNVSYKNPFYETKADWALFERMSGVFSAKGNVWGKKNWLDGSETEVFCHKATYDRKKAVARVYPKEGGFVKVRHFEPAYGVWQSKSESALFDEKSKRVDLQGQVEITGERANARAEKISYYYEGDSFKFLGSPVIWGIHKGYNFAVTGEQARSENFFDNLKVEGKVMGWIKANDKMPTDETTMVGP
jgi:hypothetical protein